MADVTRRAQASAPRLSPEEIASRGFTAAFRGVSELDVRNFLKRVSAEVQAGLDREAELAATVESLRQELADPPRVTEDQLLEALGEETARVLRSAQASADEIRTRAEEAAATLVADTEAAAATIREEADADAAAMRDAAQTAAAAREDESVSFATELRETAQAEVSALREAAEAEALANREAAAAAAAAEIEAAKGAGRDLVNEARAVRERILADLGRRRMLLQAQIDELRAGRDRLLDAYRVVKRTLGDATEALVNVEARAAAELAGPAPALGEELGPVEGELAALAGELTGESGPVSDEVEALFARLREQQDGAQGPPVTEPDPETTASSMPVAPSSDLPARAGPAADATAGVEGASEREPATTAGPAPERAAEPEPESEPEPGPTAEPGAAPEPEPEPEPEPVRAAPADDATPAVPQGGPVPEPVIDLTVEVGVVMTATTTDEEARAIRAVAIGSLAKELTRKVKRTLQDEQNDLLDRIRTVKGRPVATDVLPGADDQARALAATLRMPVDTAYASGRAAVGARAGRGAPSSMVDGLAEAMSGRLRERLVEAIDGAGDDDGAVTQRVGARYREFKHQELDEVVGDTLAAAWTLGVYDGSARGARLRWVADVEGRCADCDDNALEPTVRGEDFPTGQPHPPAHPGCRCLLVPGS